MLKLLFEGARTFGSIVDDISEALRSGCDESAAMAVSALTLGFTGLSILISSDKLYENLVTLCERRQQAHPAAMLLPRDEQALFKDYNSA